MVWIKGVNGDEIFDMGRDGGQLSLNSKFAPDVFKYSLNYFVGDYQAVGFNQPFGNWQNEPDIAQDLANRQLYNGNIRAMYIQAPSVKNALHFYKYDALNRITHSFSYEKAKITRWFTGNSITKLYQTNYDYDASGNLTTLKRKDQNAVFDRFTYHYLAGTNKLYHISDLVNSNLRTDDIDNQGIGNYVYDVNGRLISDASEGKTMTWTRDNKLKSVTDGSQTVNYTYDFSGKRIGKEVITSTYTAKTHYVLDGFGNTIAIYTDTIQSTNRKLTLSELTIFGVSRIGTIQVDSVMWNNGVTPTISNKYAQILGLKRYELNNHLGNVQTVITDRKIIQGNGNNAYFIADIVSVSDYYAYGMEIAERTWSVRSYRYSINGQEKSPELAPNHTTAEFWEYDARSGRRWNIDPEFAQFPHQSPYLTFDGSPIRMSDVLGNKADDWVKRKDGSMVYDSRVANQDDASALYGDGAEYIAVGHKYKSKDGNDIELGDLGFFKKNGEIKNSPDLAEQSDAFLYPDKAFADATALIINVQSRYRVTSWIQKGIGADLATLDASDLALPKWVMVAIIGAGTIYLLDKMAYEIEGIRRRSGGKLGFQYILTAKSTGNYNVYLWGFKNPQSTAWLQKDDIWKIGETTSRDRYDDEYLFYEGVELIEEFYGNQVQIKIAEKRRIYNYFLEHGHLPPGNKMFR